MYVCCLLAARLESNLCGLSSWKTSRTINRPGTLYYLKDYDRGVLNPTIHNPINLQIPTGPSGHAYSYLEDTTSSLYLETKSTDSNSESKYYVSEVLDS